jgi:uncharacterized membrane protein
MFSMFTLFKFLHVAAVIVWIGGVCTLTLLNLRLTGEQDRRVLAALQRQTNFFGRAVIAPAAGLTLIAGIVTTISIGFDFGALWITWGFTAILVSMVLGATLIRTTNNRIGALVTAGDANGAPLRAAQGRLGLLNLINLLLLLSAVGAMVFKPTL